MALQAPCETQALKMPEVPATPRGVCLNFRREGENLKITTVAPTLGAVGADAKNITCPKRRMPLWMSVEIPVVLLFERPHPTCKAKTTRNLRFARGQRLLSSVGRALLERVVMLARLQDSGGSEFESRRSHYSQST